MKSFFERLKESGYTYDEANSICICIENELEVPEKAEEIYWEWFNEFFRKETT